MEREKMKYSQPGNEPVTVELEVGPDTERTLVDAFNVEIEIMQGSRERLSDGRCRLVFQVSDMQKVLLMREFMFHILFGDKDKKNN